MVLRLELEGSFITRRDRKRGRKDMETNINLPINAFMELPSDMFCAFYAWYRLKIILRLEGSLIHDTLDVCF